MFVRCQLYKSQQCWNYGINTSQFVIPQAKVRGENKAVLQQLAQDSWPFSLGTFIYRVHFGAAERPAFVFNIGDPGDIYLFSK